MSWTVIKADKTGMGEPGGAKGGDGVIAGELPGKPPEDRRAAESRSDETRHETRTISERGGEGRGEEGERQAPLGVTPDKKGRRRGRRRRTAELKEERKFRRRPKR